MICLERRDILGGACVTEELWPGARVSRCSYVVSMLQPKIVSDLRLADFGYRAIPLDPAYVSLTEEGPIFFFNEVENTAKSIARYSKHDAENYPKFEALMDRAARFVKPMMLREPPALGSKAPGDLAGAAARGRPHGRLFQARHPRAGPRLHDVGRRPARRLLRARRAQGLDRVERRGRRLGRPADPGHRLQPAPPRARRVRRDRGRLGPGDRRHGRDQQGDGPLGRERRAPRSCTGAEVASIDVRNGAAIGVTLADGTELRAPIVASGAHPKTTVLDLAGAENFPTEIAEDMAATAPAAPR